MTAMFYSPPRLIPCNSLSWKRQQIEIDKWTHHRNGNSEMITSEFQHLHFSGLLVFQVKISHRHMQLSLSITQSCTVMRPHLQTAVQATNYRHVIPAVWELITHSERKKSVQLCSDPRETQNRSILLMKSQTQGWTFPTTRAQQSMEFSNKTQVRSPSPTS